jgi:hypothetical protein
MTSHDYSMLQGHDVCQEWEGLLVKVHANVMLNEGNLEEWAVPCTLWTRSIGALLGRLHFR